MPAHPVFDHQPSGMLHKEYLLVLLLVDCSMLRTILMVHNTLTVPSPLSNLARTTCLLDMKVTPTWQSKYFGGLYNQLQISSPMVIFHRKF